MKAAVIPGANQTWELQDRPNPAPSATQVLIKVQACGICYSDVWLSRGFGGNPFPWVPGHEVVGEVVEAGSAARSRKAGDRVGVPWVQATCGRCSYCLRQEPKSGQALVNCPAPVLTGMTVPGGHAELMTAEAEATVLLPENLTATAAAPLLCAGYTSWCALRTAEPRPGERVAVLGLGGLGHLALQFAKASGFETVALTHSADKKPLALELGADHVVSTGAELRDIGGADVILMTGNSGAAASESLLGLRPHGRMVLVGASLDDVPIKAITAGYFFSLQGHRVIGSTHNGPAYLREALEFASSRNIQPRVEVFAKERVGEAYERVAAGQVRFRAVVTY